ncbi:sugar transporter ERD6-like 11 isoform X2 [Tripterygium wilfordii]|uniref:sugar transporter ERD6-like 11 isoform X2 n=1 Tax=Tripterygium wilfordii TaxID=458696 RepID=UPI0018F86133|nr:sugar transporter ERD6-like 11 isoform X2 [Tripterygium wilfordii]
MKQQQGSMEEGLLLLDSNNADDCSSTKKPSRGATAIVVLSTFVAVCGPLCHGCAMGFSSPAESGIMEDLGLSLAEYSFFGSTMTIGGMIGALFSGRVASIIGRKGAMWLSELFLIIGWLAIIFAKVAWVLDMGRLLIGLGVGLITYVVPVYIAEITPKDLRGAFSSSNQLMVNLGFAIVYFIGNDIHWRTLALIGAIPCVIQLIGLFFIPESPRWQAICDREKEFEDTLQRLRGKNVDISEEADDSITKALQQQSKTTIYALFQKRYAYALTIGVGLVLSSQLGGCAALSYYGSSIFKETGFSTSIGTSTVAVVLVVSGVVGLLLMDVLGRRPLLLISSAGTCMCSFLVGLSFCLQGIGQLKDITPTMAYIGISGYFAAYTIGIAGIPWIIMSEIFPMNVKGSAGSLLALINWSSSWLVTYTFNFMMQWSPTGTFFIFAGVCGLTFVFSWKLVPETKGRTLEDIQASITHVWQ